MDCILIVLLGLKKEEKRIFKADFPPPNFDSEQANFLLGGLDFIFLWVGAGVRKIQTFKVKFSYSCFVEFEKNTS